MSGPAFDRVRNALSEATGYTPPREGGDWRCPAHDDESPSLSLKNGDGKVILHCHVGCDPKDVVAALGLRTADLWDEPRAANAPPSREVAAYDYTDEAGALLFQVVRYEPKAFRQRRPDGNGGWVWKLDDTRRVLYRLRVIEAVASDELVFVVEGEKDVHAVERAGYTATCNSGGASTSPKAAGKWRPSIRTVSSVRMSSSSPTRTHPVEPMPARSPRVLRGRPRRLNYSSPPSARTWPTSSAQASDWTNWY